MDGNTGEAEQIFTKTLNAGQCGDNVYYSYDSATGTLLLTGTGAMWHYLQESFGVSNTNSPDPRPWTPYEDQIKTLYVSEGITSIGMLAFLNCTALSTIVIGEGVKSLGGNSFYNCTSVERVFLPPTIQNIANVFEYDKENYEMYKNDFTVYGVSSSVLSSMCSSINFFSNYFPLDTYSIPYEVVSQRPDWAIIPTSLPAPSDDTLVYDTWAEGIVELAEKNDLIVDSLGMNYTKSITREQIADLLVNMLEKVAGQTLPTSSESFSDTSSVAVSKAYQASIISGRGNGIFDPNSTATRQEISIMIVRAIETQEALNGESYVDHNLTTLEGFSDFNQTDVWAQNFLAILVNHGIIGGSEGKLTPLAPTSIQECLVMTNNLYNLGK